MVSKGKPRSAISAYLRGVHAEALSRGYSFDRSKIGRVRTCRVEPQALSAAEHWLNERRQTAEQRLDRLVALLAADAPKDEETP